MAEDTVAGIAGPGCDVRLMDLNTGISQLTQAVRRGDVSIEGYDIIICLLGRAEVRRGVHLPKAVNEWLEVCQEYSGGSSLFMSGPIPTHYDSTDVLGTLRQAARYLEYRLNYEKQVHFTRLAERFFGFDGVDHRRIGEGGLTAEGMRIMDLEISDVLCGERVGFGAAVKD